jgi:Flp pilus assembly secretin CpaC
VSKLSLLTKKVAIFSLVSAQFSCYNGKVDPFDFQSGLSRDDIRNAIVKPPEQQKKNGETKEEIYIPRTLKLISAPPPPVIGGGKIISFSVTDEVPLKDVLIELGRVADIDVDLDPGIDGGVIINAKNRPLKEVIDRICTIGGLRYTYENGVLHFERDLPFMRTYFVDYLIDGELWSDVETNLDALLASAESTKSSEDSSAQSTFSSNKSAGIISVFANEKEHKMVVNYLADVEEAASAQVIIEAKIVEVKLSETFKAGITWSSAANKITSVSGLPGVTGGIAISGVNLFGDSVNSSAEALETFGTTRTIASPRLHAINNQKASLNFSDTKVFFKIDANQNVTTSVGETTNNTSSVTSTKQELDIGTQLEITPSINPRTGEIVMKISPKLSVPGTSVVDPASPTYKDADGNIVTITNSVPQVNSRTIETIAKVRSGEVLVIGGLMRDSGENTDKGVPLLANLPVLGWLFKSAEKESNITETVIFIKATIVKRGSGASKIDRDLQRKFDSNRRKFFE